MELNQSDFDKATNYLNWTKDLGICTITSLSGGKSSIYMGINYPTDYYIFAVVLTNLVEFRVKDRGLRAEIRSRIPWFEGSLEDEKTLKVILNLEQILQKPIYWVASNLTFENLITKEKILPNGLNRLCTKHLKVLPIYKKSLDLSDGYICEMNIGFRFDEFQRVFKAIGGRYIDKQWNWDNLGICDPQQKDDWRFKQFPLFSNKIDKLDVHTFFANNKKVSHLVFPDVSNCMFCFNHRKQELLEQSIRFPKQFKAFVGIEKTIDGHYFLKKPMDEYINSFTTIEQKDNLEDNLLPSCDCSN